MPHHAGDPFRIGGPAAHDTADLFRQRTDDRLLRQCVIAVIEARRSARKILGRERQAALMLVILVAVEDVVLAIVLVLHDEIDHGKPRAQRI